MLKEMVPIIAITGSCLIVFFNYWKEIRTKVRSEIYLRKLSFYEELIDHINDIQYGTDVTRGAKLAMLYNKAYIFCSNEVLLKYNEYMKLIEGRDTIPLYETKPYIANILFSCRKDLGFKKTLTIVDYKAPFPKE